MVDKKRDADNREPCIQASARLMIRWDGKTGACCPDINGKITLGDANTMHLRDIFNSQNATSLRQSLKNKTAFDKDPCRNCSSYESYKGYKAPWNS
jgi:radical SAM protein with 4Fe4S-binding SPASM domain